MLPHPASSRTASRTPSRTAADERSAPARVRRRWAALAAVLAVSLGASACSGSATDPDAPHTPAAFDKGSTVAVVLRSSVELAKPLEAALTKAEFKPTIKTAATGADQHDQLVALIASSPKVLIIDAAEAAAIRADLVQAQQAGTVVIGLSALPTETKALDYYIGADPAATGTQQGQALVDGVRGRVEKAASRVELFAGPADDAAARIRFDAAWEAIRPAIDAKQVAVGSGESAFVQVAGTPDAAAQRMSALLGSYYSGAAPQGFLAPDDATALALMQRVRDTKVPSTPFATGAGSSAAAVKALMAGQLGVTTYVDPATLSTAIATMVTELSQGKEPTLNRKDGISNGTESVPAHLLAPTLVRRGNAAATYAGNPTLKAIVAP